MRDVGQGPFLRYWRATAVSGFGTYVTLFALQTLVVVTLHGSAADVGWLNASRWLPYLVFGLIVGALVDGKRRLPIMIRTDIAQAALLLLIPLLWWIGRLSMATLLPVVVALGTASVINVAASVSLLPRLVEPHQLQPAHARIDGADAVSMTVGPAAGGLLVAALGAPLAVLADSLTYLYSALTLRRLDLDEPPPRTGTSAKDLLSEVIHGVRWIYRGSGLAALEVSTHVWWAGHAIMGVVLAPYVLADLDLTVFQFGIIGAAGGVGALLGATITTAVGRRLGTGRTIVVCHLITTLSVIVIVVAGRGMSAAATVAVLIAGQGLYGLALGMSNSHQMSYRQLVTPDQLQARTNTTLRSLNRAVVVVVAPLAGILADAWGIRPTMTLAAAIFGVVTLFLGGSSFRNVRALPA